MESELTTIRNKPIIISLRSIVIMTLDRIAIYMEDYINGMR
jgi:hypothetical protein